MPGFLFTTIINSHPEDLLEDGWCLEKGIPRSLLSLFSRASRLLLMFHYMYITIRFRASVDIQGTRRDRFLDSHAFDIREGP